MRTETYRCDGCELDFLEEELKATGGSEVYCKPCFDEKQEEQKEIIEKTAYDTYKLIDLAHQGMLSDRDNHHYAKYSLASYYSMCIDWMDEELREQLHGSDGLDTDAKFLKAYCEAHEKEFEQDFYVDYR